MEKTRKSIGGLKGDLQLIKFDSIVNLGERAFRAGQQIYGFTKSIADAADQIVDMSRMTGMSITEFQRWDYVMKMNDVDTGTFSMAVKTLVGNMQEATKGTGDSAEAFKAIGISITDVHGNLKPLDTMLTELIEKFSSYEDGTNKIALATVLFGRSGMAMIEVLNTEKEKLESLKKEAETYGVTQESIIKRNAEAKETFIRLGIVWTTLKQQATPVLEIFTNWIELILRLKGAFDELKKSYEYIVTLGKGNKIEDLPAQVWTPESVASWYKKGGPLYTSSTQKPTAPTIGGGLSDKERANIEKSHLEFNKLQAEAYKLSESGGMPSWEDSFFSYPKQTLPDINQLNLDLAKTLAAAENLSEAGQMPDWRQSLEEIPAGLIKIDGELYELKDILGAMNIEAAAWTKDWVKNWKTDTDILGDIVKDFSSNLKLSWNVNLVKMLADGDSFADGIKQVFKGIGDSFINTIQKMITNWFLFGSITGKEESGGGLLHGGSWGGLLGSVGKILKFQHGTDYVPYTGLHHLEKGETVIPAEGNKGKQGGDTYIFVEATDVGSFERKYGSVIDSRVIAGKRYNRVGLR